VSPASLLDFEGVAGAALRACPDLLWCWFPTGRIVGREFMVGNLRGDRGESLSINLDTGLWGEFAGPERGRDLVALYAAIHGLGQGEAARGLARELSTPARSRGAGASADVVPMPKRHEQRDWPECPPRPAGGSTLRQALEIWDQAVPAEGSPVERYLSARGLMLPSGAPLRFHPSCPRGTDRSPAMIALMTDPGTNEPRGVHRTFLAQGGRHKAPGQAKMMLGGTGVVRLVPDAEVAVGLGIAEGIETALGVMERYDWRPVWAAGSAGAIGRFPVLGGIECLTVFSDADDAGASRTAARQCADRWRAAGREVTTIEPPSGVDFADLAERAM
jgi:hypothetical protein